MDASKLSTMSGFLNIYLVKAQQLDEHKLWDISKFLDDEMWMKVGRQLRVTGSELAKIEKANNDYRECANKMLKLWQNEKPESTLQDLFTALMELKWELPVRQIKEHFKMTNLQIHPTGAEITTGEPTQTSKMPEKPGLPSSQEFKASIIPINQFNEKTIWHISQCLATAKWSQVGLELGMRFTELDEIKQRNQHSNRECASRMLLVWREANPSCTLQDLFRALETLQLRSTIEEIEKCMGIK